jgi:FcoT-like thioesterase domain
MMRLADGLLSTAENWATRYPDDAGLREQVLRPYRDNAKYLKSAEVGVSPRGVVASGVFGIDESCYINDTGHFNAVEFNICYNQAAYYLIAKSIQERLLRSFALWTMDDYWRRQLPNLLIYRFESQFRRGLDRKRFEGEVGFPEPILRERPGRPPVMFIEMAVRFWDGAGGECDGHVTVVATDLPRP